MQVDLQVPWWLHVEACTSTTEFKRQVLYRHVLGVSSIRLSCFKLFATAKLRQPGGVCSSTCDFDFSPCWRWWCMSQNALVLLWPGEFLFSPKQLVACIDKCYQILVVFSLHLVKLFALEWACIIRLGHAKSEEDQDQVSTLLMYSCESVFEPTTHKGNSIRATWGCPCCRHWQTHMPSGMGEVIDSVVQLERDHS